MRTTASTGQSFFLAGDCQDPAYRNVRDNPRNKPYLTEAKAFVESLWIRYRDLKDSKNRYVKDPHFCTDAPNRFLSRFWEMYLAITLHDNGFKLERYGNDGPEFFFMHNDRKVWVEAVAPGPGDKEEDRVPGHSYGKFEDGLKVENPPEEKILLRFTGVLAGKDGKRDKYIKAVKKEIITPDDLYILAINSRGIPDGWDVDFQQPYFVKAFLPLGTPALRMDITTGKIVETFYQRRENVKKASGVEVSTTAFLDPAFSFISAILHSGVDCCNRNGIFGEDFSILHNPTASPSHRLDPSIFSWCEQIFYTDGKIERRPKQAS
jgi:hypothetical protein